MGFGKGVRTTGLEWSEAVCGDSGQEDFSENIVGGFSRLYEPEFNQNSSEF